MDGSQNNGVNSSEYKALLAMCPFPEAGCQASDLEAVGLLTDGDTNTSIGAGNLIHAAFEAASEAIPLEDATYFPVIPDGEGPEGSATLTLGPGEAVRIAFGVTEFGFTAPVYEEKVLNASNSPLQNRLAKCAYVCAMSPNCPVAVEVDED